MSAKIQEWLAGHGDFIMYRMAEGLPVKNLIIEYQIKAACEGFDKRQQKTLARSMLVMNAYVRATMQKNNFTNAGSFIGALMRWRVDAGLITHAEALKWMTLLVQEAFEQDETQNQNRRDRSQHC